MPLAAGPCPDRRRRRAAPGAHDLGLPAPIGGGEERGKRAARRSSHQRQGGDGAGEADVPGQHKEQACLLYTSDAADEL